MKNEDKDHVIYAYLVFGFAIFSLISFNVPISW
jgi:hypothetical protein